MLELEAQLQQAMAEASAATAALAQMEADRVAEIQTIEAANEAREKDFKGQLSSLQDLLDAVLRYAQP